MADAGWQTSLFAIAQQERKPALTSKVWARALDDDDPLADRIADAAGPWMVQPCPELSFVVADLGDDSGVVGAAVIGRALAVRG